MAEPEATSAPSAPSGVTPEGQVRSEKAKFAESLSFAAHASADETTPLILDTEFKRYIPSELQEGQYPANRKYRMWDCFSIVSLAWQWHRNTLILTLLSALTKCIFHRVDEVIFDAVVFKAIFVAIGFCLGFRTVDSSKRMAKAAQVIQSLISSTWNIIFLFPDGARQKVSRAMLHALEHSACYIHVLCSKRQNWWAGVVGVTPRVDGIGFQGISPQPELLKALNMAEAVINSLKQDNTHTLQRCMWRYRKTLIHNWDEIIQLCLPVITDRYASLLDACLASFSVLFPWGIRAYPLSIMEFGKEWEFVIPPQVIIIVSSLFVMTVLLGLNANAQENEEPLGTDQRDLKFSAFVKLLELAVITYEINYSRVKNALQGSKLIEDLSPEDIDLLEQATVFEMVIGLHRQEIHTCDEMPAPVKSMPMASWKALCQASWTKQHETAAGVEPIAEHMKQRLMMEV